MTGAKNQPTPTGPAVEPLLLAVADCRAAAADLREVTTVLRTQYAAVLGENDDLRTRLGEHEKALALAMRLAGICPDPADTNGKESTDVH